MGCEVNRAPADEDTSVFRVTYRPCGREVVAEDERGVALCAAHAAEIGIDCGEEE